VISSVAGVPFQPGVAQTISVPGGSSQSTCLFRPVSPMGTTDGIAGVTVGILTAADFDRVRTSGGSAEFAFHPIIVPGADAAFETFGPDLGVVYVRRGTVRFDVDVRLGKGVDTNVEERIAEVLVALLK
jgi:hypothetical protein